MLALLPAPCWPPQVPAFLSLVWALSHEVRARRGLLLGLAVPPRAVYLDLPWAGLGAGLDLINFHVSAAAGVKGPVGHAVCVP